MKSEDLRIILLDTYDVNSIGFADVSDYPSNFTPSNVNFTITSPGFPKLNVPFSPQSANVYYADDLHLGDSNQYIVPDGLYEVTLTMGSLSQYSRTFNFIRTENLDCLYDQAFLSYDLGCNCKTKLKNSLREIRLLKDGSRSAANKGDLRTSAKMYEMAHNLLKKLGDCECK